MNFERIRSQLLCRFGKSCGEEGRDDVIITSPSDLSARLGDDFVLFIGSAVSGVAPPYLPMVMDIPKAFTGVASRSFSDTYAERLYATYYEMFATTKGSYKALLGEEIKFEEFLWLLSKHSSRPALDQLLWLLYFCSKGEYGPNHLAIAQLLKSRRCRACFTTNFDNALERACEDLGVSLESPFATLGKYPEKLPDAGENPILVKLHGSILNGNCVAESAELLAARSNNTHGHIRNLLKGRNVLILGYSGQGDIDISAQLSKTKATFFWATPFDEYEQPAWAHFVVKSDLRYPQVPGNQNLLFNLAGWYPKTNWEPPSHRQCPPEIFTTWLNDADLDVRALLRSLFGWRRSNAVAHLDHADQLDLNDTVACRRLGWGYIQQRAYKRAAQVFMERLEITTAMTAIDENRADLCLGAAFALWRIGKWKSARETLYPLVHANILDFVNANATFREIVANACRIYLEVSRDLLVFLPQRRRCVEASRWEFDAISLQLLQLLKGLPNGSAQNIMLAHFVIDNINWLTGKPVQPRNVQSEFTASLDSKYPTVAWAGVLHLLQMSPVDGMQAWWKLRRQLKKAYRQDYLAKNYESLVLSFLATIVSHFGLSVPTYAAIRAVYGLRTEWSEFKFNKQLVKWERWQEEWERTGIVFTEIK